LTSKRHPLTYVRRGEYFIVRTTGAVERFQCRPTLRGIQADVGASCLDSVTLRRDAVGNAMVVMLCDDTGMIDGKPANPKATELYHSVCKPGTLHQIHGDVAIVHDGDFK
jgi:hypothetical protein